MSTEHKGVEFFVGLFFLIGLFVIAAMVMVFGRVSRGGANTYSIRVEFPNASGLIKGCDVLISGARVGTVENAPRLIDDKYTVAVTLKINQDVPIPRTASFQIRTNGMLGDSYVDVVPPSAFSPTDFAKNGETIKGQRVGGFEELTTKGGAMIDTLQNETLRKLNAELDEIKVATANINNRLLSEKNLKNIEDTFANLNEITSGFAKTARDLDEVVSKADEMVKAAEGAIKTTDGAAAEFKLTLTDFRKTAETTTKTIESARVLVNKAVSGEGTLGLLVSDKQAAADLKALIANLRRSGPLFYKDRSAAPAPAPPLAPAPRRR